MYFSAFQEVNRPPFNSSAMRRIPQTGVIGLVSRVRISGFRGYGKNGISDDSPYSHIMFMSLTRQRIYLSDYD